MRRWLVVLVALVIAVGAIYALTSLRPHKHEAEIDEASRRKLLEVLQDETP